MLSQKLKVLSIIFLLSIITLFSLNFVSSLTLVPVPDAEYNFNYNIIDLSDGVQLDHILGPYYKSTCENPYIDNTGFQAIYYDPDTDLVVEDNTPVSVAIWVNLNNGNGKYADVMTEYRDYRIRVSGNTIKFGVKVAGNACVAPLDWKYTPTYTLQSGRWYHISGVYTGSEVRLYVDGKLVARDTVGKKVSPPTKHKNLVFFAQHGIQSNCVHPDEDEFYQRCKADGISIENCKYKGAADEAKIWTNTLLTSEQIKQIYENERPLFYCNEYVCVKDSDCGIEGYVGNKYCLANDSYQSYKTYKCNNPGETNAYCSDSTKPKLIEECDYMCVSGECIDKPVTCSKDSDCGISGSLGDYCDDGDIFEDYRDYVCYNPGTAQSYCNDYITTKKVEECDNSLFCDGAETCSDSSGTPKCISGPEIDCDDGIDCTVDSCNELTDRCGWIADDSYCDNGLFCDGKETCNIATGCTSGNAIDCSINNKLVSECGFNPDSISKTFDFYSFISKCDEFSKTCSQKPVNWQDLITHKCDIKNCGAQCENNEDCGVTDCNKLDGCYGKDYYDYDNIENDCLGSCICEQSFCDDAPVSVSYNDSRCNGGEKQCVFDYNCPIIMIEPWHTCKAYDVSCLVTPFSKCVDFKCVSDESYICEECKYNCNQKTGKCNLPKIRCYTDEDCDDSNNMTQDICKHPGTPESYCKYKDLNDSCDNCVSCGTGKSYGDDLDKDPFFVYCGNGLCDIEFGESFINCPQDCEVKVNLNLIQQGNSNNIVLYAPKTEKTFLEKFSEFFGL